MTVQITTKSTIGLTDAELAQLQTLLDAGDRRGFYLAYHAMTGSERRA
ncbi:MAG: hypothetical protein AAFX39_10695 [Pseudomonadota bacterium]